MSSKRLLLLKPGVTSSRELLGDYEHWFTHRCGGLAELVPVELHQGEQPPDVRAFDGVIMTGSPLSVTEPLPWMRAAGEWMMEAAARGKSVLGVCFGHQLLAWALGATVLPNPAGRELGTVEVSLTAEGRRDALFEGLPARLEVQATHDDVVREVPQGAVLLAGNAACAVQAFGWGDRVRGGQFHPEMDAASIRYCIRAEPRLDAPARRALDEAAHDSLHGQALLENFVRFFC